MPLVLRIVAIAIVLAAFVDPAITLSARMHARIAIDVSLDVDGAARRCVGLRAAPLVGGDVRSASPRERPAIPGREPQRGVARRRGEDLPRAVSAWNPTSSRTSTPSSPAASRRCRRRSPPLSIGLPANAEGSVALVPDGKMTTGPAVALIAPAVLGETLLDKAAALVMTPPLPVLDASELLTAGDLPAGFEVLARTPGSHAPSVIVGPHGPGRVLVSGALDAWRFRGAAPSSFDRFWGRLPRRIGPGRTASPSQPGNRPVAER